MRYGGANYNFVCGKCFSDEELEGFVEGIAVSKQCDFCRRKSRKKIAARFEEVSEHIADCIRHYYDDPGNAGMSYESAEGGYQGTTYDTYEIFEQMELDFPRDGGDQLRDELAWAMPHDLWSENNPYRLSPDAQLQYSWNSFCELIKHKQRYFFSQVTREEHDEIFSPSQILKLIFSYAKDAGAFVTLKKNTSLYRARYQKPGVKFTKPSELGPPPLDAAIQTNRMSPAGIVMSYVADDIRTALAETARDPGKFAVAEFVTGRDALILDLTDLPHVPSLFWAIPNSYEYDPRPRLLFLRNLSREISQPIARDKVVHIEYVPTQVVTEYLRTNITIEGKKVDGIRYHSSRNGAGTALVLFVDQDNVVLEPEKRGMFYHVDDRWLELKSVQEKIVTKRAIAKWSS